MKRKVFEKDLVIGRIYVYTKNGCVTKQKFVGKFNEGNEINEKIKMRFISIDREMKSQCPFDPTAEWYDVTPLKFGRR